MDTSKVRTQDFFSAVQYAANNPAGILIVWNWVQIHYDEIIERYSTWILE